MQGHYTPGLVLLSIAMASAAAYVALDLASRVTAAAGPTRRRWWLGGAVSVGTGVWSMHYLSRHHHDRATVGASVAVAVVVSWLALRLAFQFRREARALAPMTLAAAVVMGLAVAGMHYTGMAAATFTAGPMHGSLARAAGVSALGTFAILAVTTMVLALAVLSTRIDTQLSAQVQAARLSEERYRLLFDRSLAGVYQSTPGGALLACNDALARMLGFPSGAALAAHGAADLFSTPQDRQHWLSRLIEAGTLPHFEHQLKHRDGHLIWVLESAALVARADGLPLLIEGTIIDITRRKEAEAQVATTAASLAASLERYRTLVETTSAIPWEMDGETLTFRYVSPMISRLFRFSTERAVGAVDVWEQVHRDDRERVRAEFLTLARSPAPEELKTEFRVHIGGGSIAYVRSVVGATRAPGDTGVVLRGITIDVTEQRRLEIELQQAQKLESLGRLAAGVAHEINTPVQFVTDSVRFLRDGMNDLAGLVACYRAAVLDPAHDDLTARRADLAAAEVTADLDYLLEQMPQALTLSLDGLERVATIVSSMKEFAHPDRKEMAAVDLNRALQSTLIVARNEYRYVADVEVDFTDLPPVVCHGGAINQAVLNLLVNAAHAIEDRGRGGAARGAITIRTWRDHDHVVIAIGDDGGGIAEAIRGKIFDPFFTTKDVGRGTGQGLAIVRSVVVDQHGGTITFDSKPGLGTTFYLRLPIDGRRVTGAAA